MNSSIQYSIQYTHAHFLSLPLFHTHPPFPLASFAVPRPLLLSFDFIFSGRRCTVHHQLWLRAELFVFLLPLSTRPCAVASEQHTTTVQCSTELARSVLHILPLLLFLFLLLLHLSSSLLEPCAGNRAMKARHMSRSRGAWTIVASSHTRTHATVLLHAIRDLRPHAAKSAATSPPQSVSSAVFLPTVHTPFSPL
ncbi:hypothetical protein BCV70DRAFT_126628 [Testicularia cyperi]|uniref:Uncharacterized protein n=1 Tax=Testicularia cyperi TaxID=1882483 RepID=A0A317XMX3_9BASI|nr:hypothetical protein BCV70DRAFT_126628 [Testicularia cyperi]